MLIWIVYEVQLYPEEMRVQLATGPVVAQPDKTGQERAFLDTITPQ